MSSRLAYRPDIEGLRAVAVLLVVAAHVKLPGFAGGFIGVDVFFVLSGYLITALLALEQEATGKLDLWAFYARRFRRLAPGLLIVLMATVLLAWLTLSPMRQLGQTIAAASAALWISNFHFAFNDLDYFAPATETNAFLHTWSLGVEEQFYLVWPWLLLLATGILARRTPAMRARHLVETLLFVLFASLALNLWLMWLAPASAFYLMPARAWQFALGALVWLGLRPLSPHLARQDKLWRGAGWLGLLLIVGSAVCLVPDAPYPGWRSLIPSLGTALVIAAGQRATATAAESAARYSTTRLLSLPPLQALGRVSYSWYLWHWPILVLGGTMYVQSSLPTRIALALFSLVCAVIGYRCVELPIRRQEALLRHPRRMIAGTLIVLLSAGTLCLTVWGEQAITELENPSYAAVQRATWDLPEHPGQCDTWIYSAAVAICIFGDPQAPRTAVLIGDSIGAQWLPALEPYLSRSGWKLYLLTKSSCPMVEKSFFYARIGQVFTVCDEWRANVLQFLRQQKPDLVVLGSAFSYPFTTTEWQEGSRQFLQDLSPNVGTVVVLRSTPLLTFDALECLAENHRPLTRWLFSETRCDCRPDMQHNDAVYAALQEAARPFANMHLLDVNGLVCPQGKCRAERDGQIVYRDRQHLTASFVRSLAAPLWQQLEPLLTVPERTP